jgi:hypothetical protein
MRIFRRWKASRAGVPFQVKRLWPPYHITFGNPVPGFSGNVELIEPYGKYTGDIVPLFRTPSGTHYYTITADWRSPGDDHIVSPRQFDLEYHHTAARAA